MGRPREVAQKYVEVADGRSELSEHARRRLGNSDNERAAARRERQSDDARRAGEADGIRHRVRCAPPGQRCLVFAFTWIGASCASTTATLAASASILALLSGKGILRCEIPNLSLMPNSYGIQVVIYSADERALSHVKYPHMFSIFAPQDLRTIGCALDDEPVRGIVFGRANWRRLAVSVIDGGTHPTGRLGGATISDVSGGSAAESACGSDGFRWRPF